MEHEFINLKDGLLTKLNLFIETQEFYLQILILLFLAIFSLTIFFGISNYIGRRKTWFKKFTKTELLADLIAQSVALLIKVVGIIITLYLIGAEAIVGFVLGTAGIIGLGISFAFKDIIENYIAGVLLSIRQPFRKGDHILVADHEGVVQRMTTRMTMIKSFSGNNISIPNATIFKASITNYSLIPERRFDFTIGINPDADANYARKVGLKELKSLEGILNSPPPLALIDSIGDSSIILSFFGWVDQDEFDFFQVRSLAIYAVKERIEEVGIEIPDPSYIIKLKNIDNKENQLAPALRKQEETNDVDYLISPQNKQSEITTQQISKEAKGDGLLNNAETE